MMWRKLLLGLLTAAAAIIVLMLLSREQAGKKLLLGDSGPLSSEKQHSDYFMEGVVSRQFDEKGQLTHVLRSPRIDHFEAAKRSAMQTPSIELIQAGGTPWTVTARNADADHGSDQLWLKEDVRLSRADAAGATTLQMETAQLKVDMTARVANTDTEVRFVSPGGFISGTGLRANFATEQLDLLANVKGHYEPPSP